jgi:hypothetical protein
LDFYSDVVGTIFDTFLTSDDVMFTPETVWKQFHQNNYNNSRLVETIYKNKVTFDQTGLSLMSMQNKKDDYVVIKFIKKELKDNKALQEELRKAKKWNDIYDTVLFERIKMYNFENKEIGKELDDKFIKYAPIGKLGNGMYLTEADAKNDAKSIIDSNNNIDETLFETLIEEHKEKMFEAYINKQAVKKTEDDKETFDKLTEFTDDRKQEIITNFAAKHKMSKEEVTNYINEALIKDKENTINKLKECY